MAKIGFIGASGLMGHGMAKNLVEKGWPVTILGHRNRAPVEDLVGRGAAEAKDVASLVAASDIVFLCVTGTPEVEDLVYRQGGIFESCRAGQIIVDTSTCQPGPTLKAAAKFAEKSVRFVDAPLTRTPAEAEQGRLNSLVGADEATFAELEPVLRGFCENVFHVGGTGAGHTMKLINNFVVIGSVALWADAMVACRKLDVDPRQLVKVVNVGAINSAMFQNVGGGAAEGDFNRSKFALRNAAKDVRYFVQAMTEVQSAGVVTAAVHQSLNQAMALGFGADDKMVGSIIEAQAKLNNVDIPVRKP